MNIAEAMQTVYRSRLDCGLESYQGVGFVAWIVDEGNRRMERHFAVDALDEAGEWLLAEAAMRTNADEDSERTKPRSLLAELANSERKDPKRATSGYRDARQQRTSST